MIGVALIAVTYVHFIRAVHQPRKKLHQLNNDFQYEQISKLEKYSINLEFYRTCSIISFKNVSMLKNEYVNFKEYSVFVVISYDYNIASKFV